VYTFTPHKNQIINYRILGIEMIAKNKEVSALEIQFPSVLERLTMPVIQIDNNLNINYINQAALKLLNEYEKTIQHRWSNFKADKKTLIGCSIETITKQLISSEYSFSDANKQYWSVELNIENLLINIHVSRNFDDSGNPIGNFIEFEDLTDARTKELKQLELAAQIQAIDKAQAVIEFNMDGTIITANENFLNTVGYSLEEIQGQHHSMFVEPTFKTSSEYKEFWQKLGQGEFESKEYKRLGKDGKEI